MLGDRAACQGVAADDQLSHARIVTAAPDKLARNASSL
jgi:hypothetical protein